MKKVITSFAIIFSIILTGCSKDELLFSKLELLNQEIESASSDATVLNKVSNARYVPDEYIIVLKDNVTDIDAEIDIIGKNAGSKAKKVFKKALKGFSMKLSADGLAITKKNPKVKYIEQDQIVSCSVIQTGVTWGLDRIDQQALPLNSSYEYNSNGSTVDAYVFDTGIRLDHQEFEGRAIYGYDPYEKTGMDGHGHGTHVAGTIGGKTCGVAKGIKLISVRVLDDDGKGYSSDIVAGLDWATEHHTSNPAVGNLSLGGAISNATDEAVRRAIADGIVICVAAGNSNDDAAFRSPARVAEAITVGATTSSDQKAPFSSYGSVVDIFAPGTYIVSAWRTSTSSYYTYSGTSMASPHVAGVAALYMEKSKQYRPIDVQAGIKLNANMNLISSIPAGTSNALLSANFIQIPTAVKLLPSVPTLSSPLNAASAQDLSVSLNWNQATNASSYSIEVSQSAGFSTIANSLNAITTNSTSLTGLIPGTTYYWRVKANNADGSSDWSASRSFTTNMTAPTLGLPTNAATNSSIAPTLNWTAITNASSYLVEISTDATFTTLLSAKNTVTTNSLGLSGLIAGTTYYWRVKANSSLTSSNWSASWSFTTNMTAPTLSLPTNASTNSSIAPTLNWTPITNASSYLVEISTDATFTTIVSAKNTVTTNSLGLTGLIAGTTYYWRVKANSSSTSSDWSSVWSFTTAMAVAPTQASPANNNSSVALNSLFKWNSTGAPLYEIEIATKNTFIASTIVARNISLNTNSFTASTLNNRTTYFWRVRSKSADGKTVSAWSAVWKFTTVK